MFTHLVLSRLEEQFVFSLKKAADAGKCFYTAMKEVKLPKYEKWANY